MSRPRIHRICPGPTTAAWALKSCISLLPSAAYASSTRAWSPSRSLPILSAPSRSASACRGRNGSVRCGRPTSSCPARRAEHAYRRAYRALAAEPPAHRDVFDVYVAADAVPYAKTPCVAADTTPKFILRVVPVRLRDLPPARRLRQPRFPVCLAGRAFRRALPGPGAAPRVSHCAPARQPVPPGRSASLAGRDPSGPSARRRDGSRRCILRTLIFRKAR